MQHGSVSLVDKGRWPQEELVATGGAGRLLAPLCCTAECSKPGVKYTEVRGGEGVSPFPERHLNVQCNSALL